MDPIIFQIGPLAIRWYGLLIALAFGIGIVLADYHAKFRNLDREKLSNLVILVIPAALIGARLYYVLFNLGYYLDNPAEILAVWNGGLAIHGGILGGFLAGYWYVRREPSLQVWPVADVIAPSLILGQAIGRWGNFFNQEAHGGPVSEEFIVKFPAFIQEGMKIEGQYHHPTFLYESLWNILVFAILFRLLREKRLPEGVVALLYLILYSMGRFLIEGLRTDSLMVGPLRTAQVVSVGSILLGGILLYHRWKAGKTE